MWVIVTKDNDVACRKTMESIITTAPNSKGILFVNGGNIADYEGIEAPAGWEIIKREKYCCPAEVVNKLFLNYPDEHLYGIIPDNCILKTAEWDTKLEESVAGRYIVDSNDGNDATCRAAGVIAWPGELLRKVGFWTLKGTYQTATEWVWEKIAQDFVLRKRNLGVMCEYVVPKVDKAKLAFIPLDKEIFDFWREKEYYKLFRKLMFGGEYWNGRTNFPKEEA